jgi:hypothetical protein
LINVMIAASAKKRLSFTFSIFAPTGLPGAAGGGLGCWNLRSSVAEVSARRRRGPCYAFYDSRSFNRKAVMWATLIFP